MLPEELWRYRTFWRRFWAGGIDALVFALPSMFIASAGPNLTGLPAIALSTGMTAFGLLYSIGGHALFGQTVGKFVCRVQVLDLEGRIPGWPRAALRDFVPLLSALGSVAQDYQTFVVRGRTTADLMLEMKARMEAGKETAPEVTWLALVPLLWFFLELVTMLLNPRRRALHDYIAGTVVVWGRLLRPPDE